MIDKTLTTEEAKKETLALLGSTDASLVSYITDEYLAENYTEFVPTSVNEEKDENGKMIRTIYGHNMSYGRLNDGRLVYFFLSNESGTSGCSKTHRHWCTQADWNHYATNTICSPGGEVNRMLRFVEER
ncbi:MAG: hypothetical protein EP305_04415 [Bacteroidetes bacterium]|nr:MAG: hypothetical protein EP305_04415 [Bacteroidota bacterium]